MKARLFALLLVLLLPAGLAADEGAGLRLVVQQNGQALVSETRQTALPKGQGNVVLSGLPATLLPQTLQVRSRTAPAALVIQDIALDDELLTPQTLLKRHLGKKVLLVLPDGRTQDGRVQKEATVLSLQEAPLFLIDGQVYSGPYESIRYPELPEGLGPEPRLSMNVNNSGPAKQELQLEYLAREIRWSMDYVLTMNKAATSGTLSGWVTLNNRSGRDFTAARVELLAGEPRSVQPGPFRAMYKSMDLAMAEAAPAPAESGELFEYQLYKLKQRVSLANQQSRQVRLFEPARIAVERKLVGRHYAMPSGRESEPEKQALDAVVSFRNTEAQGLGLPLPKGVLRAFQDEDGARHFLGEAPLERTAVGAGVEVVLGKAFDVDVERVVLEYEETGKRSYRATWALRIRNARKEAQRVIIQEQVPGKWKLEEASQKWSRPSAGVLEFVVDVPPSRDKEPMVLKYTFSATL